MTDFIAIDVETANYEPSSICSIGAVKVRDSIIIDRRYSLVKPEPDYYHWACRRVHGLSDSDTYDAPSFGTVWTQWTDWFENLPFVAHNAAFDSKCISAASRIYGIESDISWHCTLKAARCLIPRAMLPSKSLDSLCDFFGITLGNHHNALDDALACAKLAIILNQNE
ncbi:MAG: exonuclease domain-containing protein [Odoribacter sp.]|nr:exonuclease domain-containing protein [Odoribacter sp.]